MARCVASKARGEECETPTGRAVTLPREIRMNKQVVIERLEEFLIVVFLSFGPALGAVVASILLVGLIWGLIAVLGR